MFWKFSRKTKQFLKEIDEYNKKVDEYQRELEIRLQNYIKHMDRKELEDSLLDCLY